MKDFYNTVGVKNIFKAFWELCPLIIIADVILRIIEVLFVIIGIKTGYALFGIISVIIMNVASTKIGEYLAHYGIVSGERVLMLASLKWIIKNYGVSEEDKYVKRLKTKIVNHWVDLNDYVDFLDNIDNIIAEEES